MMKEKILKHKKIIVLCLLCFMSFNIITDYKQKEVQAVIGIDDALLWYLGLLVLSTGVVAVHKDQIKDMGYEVYNELSLDKEAYLEAIGQSPEQLEETDTLFKNRFLKVTDKLKEIVNQVAETLTTEDKIIETPGELIDNKIVFNMPTNANLGDRVELGSYTITGVKSSPKLKILDSVSDGVFASYDVVQGKTIRLWAIYSTIYYSWGTREKWKIYNDVDDSSPSASGNSFYILSENCTVDYSGIEVIPYSNPLIKEGYYPTEIDNNIEDDTYIPVPQTIPADVVTTTDIPLTWDKVIDTGLITDIPASKYREITGDFTQDLTGTVTGSLDSVLDITFPNIIDLLKQLLIYLFYPTVSVSELFSIPAGSGFATLSDLFNWDSIFNIEPKPYEFKTNMEMDTLLEENEGARNWDIEIKIFDTEFMKNNIGIVRNVLSYSLLISVIYFIVYHFIPRRDMD